MHTRSNVDIHTDVEILELRIYERIDSHTTDTGLERSCCHRNAVADFEGRFQAIRCANLWVLQQLAVAVRKQKVERCLRNRDLKIIGVEILEIIQAKRTV